MSEVKIMTKNGLVKDPYSFDFGMYMPYIFRLIDLFTCKTPMSKFKNIINTFLEFNLICSSIRNKAIENFSDFITDSGNMAEAMLEFERNNGRVFNDECRNLLELLYLQTQNGENIFYWPSSKEDVAMWLELLRSNNKFKTRIVIKENNGALDIIRKTPNQTQTITLRTSTDVDDIYDIQTLVDIFIHLMVESAKFKIQTLLKNEDFTRIYVLAEIVNYVQNVFVNIPSWCNSYVGCGNNNLLTLLQNGSKFNGVINMPRYFYNFTEWLEQWYYSKQNEVPAEDTYLQLIIAVYNRLNTLVSSIGTFRN